VFRKKKYFLHLAKNALTYYDAGVAVVNLKVVGLAPRVVNVAIAGLVGGNAECKKLVSWFNIYLLRSLCFKLLVNRNDCLSTRVTR
jgi:hypothetical protein